MTYCYNYSYVRPSTYVCALLFSLAMLAFLVGCIIMSFMSAGPLILGTEMNIDGSVEYLCLGTDCERLWL